MGTQEDGLMAAFEKVCELFNDRKWGELEPLLHNDVTMKRIDDPVAYHAGRPAVMGYFHGHGEDDKATFKATSKHPEIVEDTLGLVSGSALWEGTSGDAKVPIAYAYVFRKNVEGKWLALNLWGGYCKKY